jgi:hypothetical protein
LNFSFLPSVLKRVWNACGGRDWLLIQAGYLILRKAREIFPKAKEEKEEPPENK